MDPVTISLIFAATFKLIDMGVSLYEAKQADRSRFDQYRAQVEAMVLADEPPTPEQWQALLDDMDGTQAELNAILAQKRAAEGEAIG